MRSIVVAAALAFAGAALADVQVTFGPKDVTVVREYYAAAAAQPGKGKKHGKEKEMPPGLQKKVEAGGSLPPGLRKRLDRGEPLPPGLAKRALPAELDKRLPRLPTGYSRYVVGQDVVLVDTRRNVVLDIIVDVVL